MSKSVKPLFESPEWTFDLIRQVTDECQIIADEELKLDYYPNQIEIISSEQMLDAYASVGMPVMYQHWSYGKSFAYNETNYRKGLQGLAYEIVINSNPCISYLMEENSMTMQTLVIAHAAFGHNHFFKSNELFRQWTDAEGIIDYLVFAKGFVAQCEEKHGREAVEAILDSCHALGGQGVDRYRRPSPLSKETVELRKAEREAAVQAELNDLWRTVPGNEKEDPKLSDIKVRQTKLKLPEENLLYFIEKKSPILEGWQRELIRITRKINQYFYPQRQTKVMNEGTATFVHYYIMNRLYEKGLLTEGSMLEFMHSHSGVVFQPDFNDRRYGGINPYTLGFKMFMDIKRICENPTSEDRDWFPDIAGTSWLETFHFAIKNFRDESFIRQYLSPTVMRDMHLFSIQDNETEEQYHVENIHNDSGFKGLRKSLAATYNVANHDPDIQVWDVDFRGNRTLNLRHTMYRKIELSKQAPEVLKHVRRLWGYDVVMDTYDAEEEKIVKTIKSE